MFLMLISELIGSIVAFIVALLLFVFLITIPSYLIFEKMGMPGWKGLIPIYRDYCLAERTIDSVTAIVYAALTLFIGFVNNKNTDTGAGLMTAFLEIVYIVLLFRVNYRIAKGFGDGVLVAIALTLVPGIMLPILGYGSAEYSD